MAEVTGDIGGQSVVLNNAATESTLRELLVAINSLAAASKSGGSASKEVEKLAKAADQASREGKKFSQETQRSYLAHKANSAAIKNNTDAVESNTSAIGKTIKGFGALAGAATGAVKALGNIANTVAGLGSSFSSVADAFAQLPFGVGDVVGPIFKAVAGAADRVQKSFYQTSSVGANFGASITDMIDAASAAGLGIDQFTGLIAKNGDSLRALGTNTSDGAKRLANMAKMLKQGEGPLQGLQDGLVRLGYDTEAQAEALARYGRMQRITNQGRQLSDQQLILSTAEYLKNLDAVSKLTGKTKDQLMAEQERQAADYEFQMAASTLDEGGQGVLRTLMLSIPEEMQQGVKEIFARGNFSGPEAQKLARLFPEMAQAALETAQGMQQSGTLTVDAAGKLDDALIKSSKELAMDERRRVQIGYNMDEYGQLATGALKAQALEQGRFVETYKQQAKEEEDARKRIAEGLEGNGPAELERGAQKMRQAGNEMTKTLSQSEAFDKMIEAATAASSFINEHMVGALEFVTGNLWTMAAAVAAASLALKGYAAKQALDARRAAKAAGGKGGGTALAGAGANRGVGNAADDIGKKAATEAAEKGAKTGTKAATDVASKTATKSALRFLGPVAAGALAITDSIQGWNDAANLLGKEEGEEATTGEKASAALGNVISGLTFGLLDASNAAQGIADFFGAGADDAKEMADLKKEAAKNSSPVNPPNSSPVEYDLPKFASGGVINAPKSGAPALLHGKEAVIPLDNSAVLGPLSEALINKMADSAAKIKLAESFMMGGNDVNVQRSKEAQALIDTVKAEIDAVKSQMEAVGMDTSMLDYTYKPSTAAIPQSMIDELMADDDEPMIAKATSKSKTTDANAQQRSLEADADAKRKKAEEEALAAKKKADEEGAVKAVDSESVQKESKDMLAQLNNSMAELVRLTKSGVDVNKKQLGVQKASSGNLFAGV